MKTLITYIFSFYLIALSVGCFRNDTRVEEFNVPGMKSPECFSYLEGKLRGVEGVTDAQFDEAAQTVIVTFSGLKLGYKNIEFVIAGSGFDCNETPASSSAKAALPAACR